MRKAHNKLSFKEVQQRFFKQGREDITLCEDGFNGWSQKSKFWDNILNEEWWAKPNNVYNQKSVSLKRSKHRTYKITYEEAQKRFIDANRTDIFLCYEEYRFWGCKTKFYDLIEKDYFWAKPNNVLKQNSGHPNRKSKRYIKTCLEKYGTENISQVLFIKEKKKKKSLEKYGVECILQAPKIKRNIKEKWKKKYGVEWPQQNIKIKEKQKKSINKKYGADNISQTKYYKSKFSKIIIETNQYLPDWYKTITSPKPPYKNFCRSFEGKNINLKDLESYIQSYKENKTKLEQYVEKLLNLKHYNKKIFGKKPDFKLNDNVFLNVDGLYWHSEINRDRLYHYNLKKHFEKNNCFIYQIRENEIYNKPNVIKNLYNVIINPILISSKECEYKNITFNEAQKFYNLNHISNFITYGKCVGVYNNNVLIYIITYKIVNNICTIIKFAAKENYYIKDVFVEFINFFNNKNYKYIILSNDRYNPSSFFTEQNFIKYESTIQYEWTDNKETFNNNITKKLNKIYNAGRSKFVYKQLQ